MLTTPRSPQMTRKEQWGMFLKIIRMLPLMVLASGLLLGTPASAQLIETVDAKGGSIQGAVVDISSDPIPGATVTLQGPAGSRFSELTKDDGTFAFQNVTPAALYQMTVTAEGFADWTSSLTVEPGKKMTLNSIKLSILAVQRAVTVSYSSKEVAAQQLKAEEQQRVLGFIPNMSQ
jgi:hypothetical protein